MPTGVLVYFAVSVVVAVAAFALIRRWLVAVAASLLGAPIGFVIVCLAFNAIGHAPRIIDFLIFVAMAVPATTSIAVARFVLARFRGMRRARPR